jgi:hypothetical protein
MGIALPSEIVRTLSAFRRVVIGRDDTSPASTGTDRDPETAK